MNNSQQSNPENFVCLGIAEMNEAKRIRELMAKDGVTVDIRSNPATCSAGGGCAVRVELWVAEQEAEKVVAQLSKERMKSLEGLEVDSEQLASVFDPSQESVQCPACGTKFSPKENECPECGLVFMAE